MPDNFSKWAILKIFSTHLKVLCSIKKYIRDETHDEAVVNTVGCYNSCLLFYQYSKLLSHFSDKLLECFFNAWKC